VGDDVWGLTGDQSWAAASNVFIPQAIAAICLLLAKALFYDACAFQLISEDIHVKLLQFQLEPAATGACATAAVPLQSTALCGSSSAAAAAAGSTSASAAEEQEVEELLQKLDSAGVDRSRVSHARH
jgi:hypothetical protein